MNKERQASGLVDFDLYSHNLPNNLTNNLTNFNKNSNNNNNNNNKNPNNKSIPQQNLVVKNKIENLEFNNSRREFLNGKPLIIDAGMIPNTNNGINTCGPAGILPPPPPVPVLLNLTKELCANLLT